MQRRKLFLLFAMVTQQRLWAFDSPQTRRTKNPRNQEQPESLWGYFAGKYTYLPRGPSFSVRYLSNDDNEQGGRDEKETDFFLSVEEFLDKPFFDPDAYNEDDDSFLGRLATFVKSDYEFAETMYVGTFGVILIIISQELLRMQLYGDQYSSSSSISRLF